MMRTWDFYKSLSRRGGRSKHLATLRNGYHVIFQALDHQQWNQDLRNRLRIVVNRAHRVGDGDFYESMRHARHIVL